MMISPSKDPPSQETESVTVTVEPSEGAEARTGEQSVTEVSMTIIRNVAVRMLNPRRRGKSTLLCLVRNVFPTDCIPNKVE